MTSINNTTQTRDSTSTSWAATLLRMLFSAQMLGLIALGIFITLRLTDQPVVREIRHSGFDLLQTLKPREYTPQPVRIVDIDERSLQTIGQWPWPRTKIAEMITNLTNAGAVVIGFDVIFSEKDRLSPSSIASDNPSLPPDVRRELNRLPDNEVPMSEAMRRSRVVLGETSVRNVDDEGTRGREIRDAPHAALGGDPKPFLVDFFDLVQNMEVLDEAAVGRGLFSVRAGSDGVIRTIPLVMKVGGAVRLALSAETLRVATGGDSFAIKSDPDLGIRGIVVAGKEILTDKNGQIWPYFTPSLPERYVSAADILNGTADINALRGHLVLVGTSAVGLEDYRSVPLGNQVPGVEIHAQVIENLLTDQTLIRPNYAIGYEFFAILIPGLAIIFLVPKLGAVYSAILAVLTIGLTIGASWYGFSSHRLLLDATWPVITAIGLSILAATLNYIREERQKRQIRSAFGQYLSPALVGRLADNPEELVLGGETRELTVLFTDIRGFTTISESYKDYPEGLTQLMNRFLTVLSNPILERNGTIDKYMGDAIMAFWNAPFDFEHHVMEACLAAIEMIENVEQLNIDRADELKDSTIETFHAIKVGIGINTGTCVVGNMGSENRFDYTALGDTVNIASRLEGQSKPYGLNIVIGAQTADTVKDTLAIFEIDLIRVKGKNEPVRIYSLVGREDLAQSEAFEEFRAVNSAMIASYRAQEWDAAFEALELLEDLGEKIGVSVEEYLLIYEARITEFQSNPPGANWDGVYTAMSK